MVDLKSDENTFRIHPEDEPKYDLTQFKEYNESMESYIGLMNTFLIEKIGVSLVDIKDLRPLVIEYIENNQTDNQAVIKNMKNKC